MDDTPSPQTLVAWIHKAQAGDKQAVAALYEAFVDRIYRFLALRVDASDAEDLTAEVFLIMVRSLPSYRPSDVPFEAWLYRIAANRANEFHRRRYRAPQVPLDDNHRDDTPTQEETLEAKEDAAALAHALRRLPAEQQTVLILRFVERMSHQAVAALLKKKPQTVKNIQHRALRQLAQWLNIHKQRHYLRGESGDD